MVINKKAKKVSILLLKNHLRESLRMPTGVVIRGYDRDKGQHLADGG